MDKKQDPSRDLFDEVKELIDNNKLIELKEMLDEYHTMDIYDVLMELDENSRVKLFEILPMDTAASILEECDPEFFINMVENIEKEHIRNVFDEMSLGDLADILRDLDDEEAEKILDVVSLEDEMELRELLAYVDETSGSTMKKGYITVNKNLNVAQAIRHIRSESTDADSIYYIYVIDNKQKLVGVLSIRELFLSKDSAIIEDLMVENVKTVADTDDREEAVRIVSKYNLMAVPVVDSEGTLKGIITVDDVIDVMEEEASEDMYKFAGSSERERDVAENENSTLAQQVISCVRARLGWLVMTAVLSFVTSIIFMRFANMIDYKPFAILIFFAPLVLAIGGNAGTQSSAVTIINLINNDKDVDTNTIMKEIISSIVNGIILALISGGVLFMFMRSVEVSMVVAISVFINMILGVSLGTFMPILLKKMENDPSVVSSQIVTVFMDIIGIAVYFIVLMGFGIL